MTSTDCCVNCVILTIPNESQWMVNGFQIIAKHIFADSPCLLWRMAIAQYLEMVNLTYPHKKARIRAKIDTRFTRTRFNQKAGLLANNLVPIVLIRLNILIYYMQDTQVF